MRSRPWVLFAMALSYSVIAISFPLQVFFLYEHTWNETPEALSKLTLVNWLVMASLVTGAILFYRGSTKMVPAAIMISLLVLGNNTLVGLFGDDYNLWQTVSASVMFGGMHLILLNPEVQRLIRQPELRWWRTAYRQKLTIPVVIRAKNYHQLDFDSFDISDSGIFLKVPTDILRNLKGLKLNEVIHLNMKFDTLNQIRCHARITRISEGGGIYPSGIGVEFTDLSAKDRKRIHRFRAKKLPMSLQLDADAASF